MVPVPQGASPYVSPYAHRTTLRTSFKLALQPEIPARANCFSTRIVTVEKWGDFAKKERLSVAEWARNMLTGNPDILVKIARRHPAIGESGTGVVHIFCGCGYEILVGINADPEDYQREWHKLNRLGVGICVAAVEGLETDEDAQRIEDQVGTSCQNQCIFHHVLAYLEAGKAESSLRIYMHTLGAPGGMVNESEERMLIFNVTTRPDDPYRVVRMDRMSDMEARIKSTGTLVVANSVAKGASGESAAVAVGAVAVAAASNPRSKNKKRKRQALVLSPGDNQHRHRFSASEMELLTLAFMTGGRDESEDARQTNGSTKKRKKKSKRSAKTAPPSSSSPKPKSTKAVPNTAPVASKQLNAKASTPRKSTKKTEQFVAPKGAPTSAEPASPRRSPRRLCNQ